jgi:hypothetical protein
VVVDSPGGSAAKSLEDNVVSDADAAPVSVPKL